MIAQFKKGTYRWSILAIILLAVLGSVALTNGRTIKGDNSALVKIMPEDLYKNLVLYYSFDKDGGTKAVDISGMDFHGKVHGAKWIEEGACGGAMSFDGEDDYIGIGEMSLKAFTLSAWVKVLVPERPVIIRDIRELPEKAGQTNIKGETSEFPAGGLALPIRPRYRGIDNRRVFLLDDGEHFYAIQLNNKGGLGFSASNQRGGEDIGANEYDWHFARDEWTHITVTYDGTKVNIYKNGRLTETGEDTFIKSITGTAYIGGITSHDGEFWHGMMDEVAIFNRALNEPEVGQLYQIASGLTTESVKIIPTGLVGHWSFDNDDGDTVIDSSPYANHGKLKTAVKETAITKWASQKNVSELLDEADSFVTQMAQAKEREDWRSVSVGAQKLWYILRKLKTTMPRGTPGRALESRIKFSPEAPQHYREKVPELSDCISRLEELCDDLHSSIRDKKMSVVSEIYQEFNKQWASFNSIVQFKPGAGKTGPTLVDGILGQAYYFDGKDDYVDCGNDENLNVTELTWSLWIKRTETTYSNERALISNTGPKTGPEESRGTYALQIDEGGQYQDKIQFVRHGMPVEQCPLSKTAINDMNWHHIAVTRYINGDVTIYIDGYEDATGYLPERTAYGKTFIGTGHTSYSNFKGSIDEVAIYNRALSAEEIRQLYNLTNLEEQEN